MSRPKGVKNKKRADAREKYWRAEFGVDDVSEEARRVRKHRARKEQAAENAASAAELEKYLASDPPDTLMTWVKKAKLAQIRAGEVRIDAPGFNSLRSEALSAAMKKQSEESDRAFDKRYRRERLRKWLAQRDELMELYKQHRRWNKL